MQINYRRSKSHSKSPTTPTHTDTHSKSHRRPFAFLRTGDHSTSDDPSHSLLLPKPSLTVTTVRSLQLAMVQSIHRCQNPASNRDGSHYLQCFRPHRRRYDSLASTRDGSVASAHDGSIYSLSLKPSISSRRFDLFTVAKTQPHRRDGSLASTHYGSIYSPSPKSSIK